MEYSRIYQKYFPSIRVGLLTPPRKVIYCAPHVRDSNLSLRIIDKGGLCLNSLYANATTKADTISEVEAKEPKHLEVSEPIVIDDNEYLNEVSVYVPSNEYYGDVPRYLKQSLADKVEFNIERVAKDMMYTDFTKMYLVGMEMSSRNDFKDLIEASPEGKFICESM